MVVGFSGTRYGREGNEMFCVCCIEDNFHLDFSVLGCLFRYIVM